MSQFHFKIHSLDQPMLQMHYLFDALLIVLANAKW